MVDKINNTFINATVVRYAEVVTSVTGYGTDTTKQSYEFELDSHIRLYNCRENRDFLFSNLTMYARDLMMAIYHMVNHEYQYVVITYDKIVQLYGGKYSKRRYDDTIKELVRHNILDCKERAKGQFWYNPVFFAAGNRLKMYPECKMKVQTINKYQEAQS